MLAHCTTLLLATAILITAGQAQDICYGPDGNQKSDLVVCNPGVSPGACCSPGEMCYSNGLCQIPGVTQANATYKTIYTVKGCTDENGDHGECWPWHKCKGKGLDKDKMGVQSCGTNKFCCYGETGCDCKNTASVFSLSAGSVATTLPVRDSKQTSVPSSTSVDPATITGNSNATAVMQTDSPTISPAVAQYTAASPSQSSSPSNLVAIEAGAGVGAGVAVLSLSVVGIMLWRRRKSARQYKELEDSREAKFSSPAPMYSPKAYEVGSFDSPSVYRQPEPAHLSSEEIHELNGSHGICEMDAAPRTRQNNKTPSMAAVTSPFRSRFQ